MIKTSWLEKTLEKADIRIGGDRPWDIKIYDPNFLSQVLIKGSLAIGEGYVDKKWDVERLDEAFYRLFKAHLDGGIAAGFPQLIQRIKRMLINPQSKGRAFQVGEEHYDLDIDVFKKMLDKRLTYSCAYFKEGDDLNMAQEHKLELIAKKIGLEPGMTVLDVGSGFGSFSIYAAERYGAVCTGITVSKSQLEEATHRAKGLPVTFKLMDWRDLNGKWDRIVSVGQFEHVGQKNYREYMKIMKNSLSPDGLFLLHTIGNDTTYKTVDPWIEKYIFPNGQVPSLKQIADAQEGLFVIEDVHNFGANYDKTLMAWFHNFDKTFPDKDTPFYRMWKYYLLTCAAAFRARRMELWQLVLSPNGVPGGYKRPCF